jgi:hypothetical protein
VFTARYALSPYIKQIRFVFKGSICCRHNFMGCLNGTVRGICRTALPAVYCSSVSIVTRLRAAQSCNLCVRFLTPLPLFSSPKCLDPSWGLSSLLFGGQHGAFRWGEVAGAWGWPLIASGADVKHAWSYTSVPPHVFTACWCMECRQTDRRVQHYVPHRTELLVWVRLVCILCC